MRHVQSRCVWRTAPIFEPLPDLRIGTFSPPWSTERYFVTTCKNVNKYSTLFRPKLRCVSLHNYITECFSLVERDCIPRQTIKRPSHKVQPPFPFKCSILLCRIYWLNRVRSRWIATDFSKFWAANFEIHFAGMKTH